ncbi:hypothetical protein Ahy_A03g011793 [Arachis hypogaea]|uniref:Replication protein A 70 kDa DNA-binding subunit B/D first OB fold domain-containing protein n=1 Tax=Arachis hypogaea TaxID=3818 RepID=A0A445DRR7_ARAHY|nr:hypothetical protein Ahy_A03g011793 [Arachis hypogaea]
MGISAIPLDPTMRVLFSLLCLFLLPKVPLSLSVDHTSFSILISPFWIADVATTVQEKITPWRESWKVHVKVVKLWYHKNPALDLSQNLLHMVLMDEKLHKIQATIRDQLISNFAVSLNEGDLYLMTHFTVVPNTGLNRVTKHRFRLLFQYKTFVVSVVSPRIPHSDLCFTSIDEIDQMTKDHNFLINFVGIITGVRKERDVALYGKLIKAVVLEVQCNVFENACDLLEYDKLQKYPRSLLIVLESFKIKAIEGGVILQNVINVSRLFINPDIPESVEFLSRFSVASYEFSRLVTNDLGYLVSKVDGDYFNPKEISNIQDLHADKGYIIVFKILQDAHCFVIGTIKEVIDEPDWWYYLCVCSHALVEHEDLYLCDACGSCVEHVMVKYGIRVKIHHAGCAVLFVLLDNAAIKLFGKTCSEAFLRIEEEFPVDPSVLAVCWSYSPQMFDDAVGEEKVFKVEIHSAVDPDYSRCFKIVNVFSHNPEPAATNDYINAMLHNPIFPPIYDTYLQYATGKDYKTQVVCDNSIQSETIEDIITDLISPNRCYYDAENWFSTSLYGSLVSANKQILSCDLCQLQCIDAVPRFCLKIVVSHANGNNIFVLKDREVVQIIKTRCLSILDNHPELNQGSYCKVVPLKLISSVLHKKVVFMVDARPVGYEMNRSVYIVKQIWDDASVINVFEAATEMNEHKIHVLVDSMPEVEDPFSQCGSDHEAKISPWKEAWSIEAKILTIWENASIVNENMQKLLHVVLIDKQHDKVQEIVEDDLITTFIHQLKEGHVFIISDFKVIPNGGLVRVTTHRFHILFKCSTSVVVAASTVIDNLGLSLTSMDEILQKRTDYEYLIDFVGVLCRLKRKTDVECNGKIFKVIVLEVFTDGKKIPCNLVGDCSALIDINSLKKYQRPPVLILQSFKIKVSGDKVSLQNMINVSRVSINPDMQETDGQFFVVGKIKEIVGDSEWWVISCVCGHPIVGDDNQISPAFYDQIVVEDRTSCGMFVLLDSAATKLLGRTCSDKIEHQYCPQFFHQLIGKEIVLKVQAKRINTPGYCGTFKIINDVSSDSAFSPTLEDFPQHGQLRSYENQVISGVPIQLHSIKEMLADILCAKIYSSASRNDHIYFLIGEIIDVLKYQKWWYYCYLCNAPISHVGNVFYCYLCRVECVDAIRRYRIKIIVFHSNGSNIFIFEDDEVMQILKKSCSDFLIDEGNSSQSKDDYTVPNSMISQLMNKKIVFIVDPRPVGYELNTYLHVVHAICDDIDITVNHNFHARILSSQDFNFFENHQPLTIREERQSAFGQCENTGNIVERMDECSN